MAVPGFEPDPELAWVIDQILATAPPSFVEWRRVQLEDPIFDEYRERDPDDELIFYDPDYLRKVIAGWDDPNRHGPYSKSMMRLEAFAMVLQAGCTVEVTDLETGEYQGTWECPGSPEGAAPLN